MKVFVYKYDEHGVPDYQEMDKAEADSGRIIIKCRKCDKPATHLDHYFPYHSEMNVCDEHLNT